MLKNFLRKWWNGGDEPFTIACDVSHWHGGDTDPITGRDREQLFRVRGIHTAKRFAMKWVNDHVHGQARVLKGHIFWPDEIDYSI